MQVWTGIDLQNKALLGGFSDVVDELSSLDSLSFQREEKQLKFDRDESDEDLGEIDIPEQGSEEEEDVERDEDGSGEEEEKESEEESESEGNDKDDDDDVWNDPDFQHMSDSDLDDLPLFDKKDSDDEPLEGDDEKDDEKERQAELKERETEKKTDDYMNNALGAIRSAVGKDPESKGKGARSEVEDRFPQFRRDGKVS